MGKADASKGVGIVVVPNRRWMSAACGPEKIATHILPAVPFWMSRVIVLVSM